MNFLNLDSAQLYGMVLTFVGTGRNKKRKHEHEETEVLLITAKCQYRLPFLSINLFLHRFVVD